MILEKRANTVTKSVTRKEGTTLTFWKWKYVS